MKKRKVRLFLAAISTIAMILGCLVIPGGTVSEAAGKKLKVTYKKTVAVNCTTTIKTNIKAKFKSSNKKIATVSSKGVVKGKKAGKVKITVTSKSNKNMKKIITINVNNRLVINAPADSKATLSVGESVKIKANLSSKFTSSDSNVATVNSNGTVTAKSAGTATITVTSKKYKKLVKKVTITVKNETTEKPTTEKPTTEKPTTEKPTTEKTTTEKPSAETPTTEAPTTETPSTEQSAPEEKKVVGIEANYGNNRVPYLAVDYLFSELGIIITLLYDDGTKEELPPYESSQSQVVKVNVETVDYGAIITYIVTYKSFTDEMTIEYIYTDDIYPRGIYVDPVGVKKGEPTELSSGDYKALVVYSDYSEEYIDNSNCRYSYIEETEKHNYMYLIVYDYYFTDSNGNDLYVSQADYLYLPHE